VLDYFTVFDAIGVEAGSRILLRRVFGKLLRVTETILRLTLDSMSSGWGKTLIESGGQRIRAVSS
jgi:hypothetical protein